MPKSKTHLKRRLHLKNSSNRNNRRRKNRKMYQGKVYEPRQSIVMVGKETLDLYNNLLQEEAQEYLKYE